MGVASSMRVEEKTLGKAFSDIPHVESVFVFNEQDAVRVFTVIDEDDDAAYRGIYEREIEIARQFDPHTIEFRVIARRGRPVEEIVGSRIPAWQRSNKASTCLNATNT